ncbi:hypothetical protein [Vampirovibrio sp.]|uniref:phage adaptor protein n=1 Tax=Vampirovibrio sp. TaxID=2717857 RepID=UPI003594869B
MSTLLQLVNEVLRRTGQQEATTLLNAQTPIIQTVDFLNDTYFEMLQRLKVRRLTQSNSLMTVAGQATYTLDANVDLDALLPDSVRDASNATPLPEISSTYAIELGENASGKPQYFYRNGSQLHLYPVPDGVYTIDYQAQIKPQTLSQNSDITALPVSWEKVLIMGAQARLEKFLGEPASETYLLYRDGLLQLKSLAPRKPGYRMKGFYRGARSV